MSAFRDVRFSERDRRIMLLGGLAVVVMLVAFRGIPMWRAWVRDAQASAVLATERLAAVRQRITQPVETQRIADSLAQASLALAPALLDGDTPAQAAASLASYVSESASLAGIRLGGMQITIDSTTRNTVLYRVRVRTDATGDVQGLTTLLHVLEGGSAPLLSVRSFAVSQSEPGAPSDRPESLRMSMEIEGLARRMMEP